MAARYKTKQQEILLDCVKSMSSAHFTAAEVYASLKTRNARVAQATVYRGLESLVEQGSVKKYIIDVNSPTCFEYVGSDACTGNETCFHCKCEKCGKLIHLHCDELKMIQAHMSKEHRFNLDPMRTVFYGLCEDCI